MDNYGAAAADTAKLSWPTVEVVGRIRPGGLTTPHPSRFPADRADYADCLAAHGQAVAEGRSGYLDPSTGLFVMTAANLAAVGLCCDRGCRHCPYVGASAMAEQASTTEENEETGE